MSPSPRSHADRCIRLGQEAAPASSRATRQRRPGLSAQPSPSIALWIAAHTTPETPCGSRVRHLSHATGTDSCCATICRPPHVPARRAAPSAPSGLQAPSQRTASGALDRRHTGTPSPFHAAMRYSGVSQVYVGTRLQADRRGFPTPRAQPAFSSAVPFTLPVALGRLTSDFRRRFDTALRFGETSSKLAPNITTTDYPLDIEPRPVSPARCRMRTPLDHPPLLGGPER
jgi:hypothetical protein